MNIFVFKLQPMHVQMENKSCLQFMCSSLAALRVAQIHNVNPTILEVIEL
jgi:hypothetical protein